MGVDPEGSYFPRTVKRRPASSPLEASYQQEIFPARFLLPEGVESTILKQSPLRATVEVTSDSSFTAVYQSFDFAGWQATVDQQSVSITPSDPGGLITFEVPAGTHAVSVNWGSTLLRSTLLGLSLIALTSVSFLSLRQPHVKSVFPVTLILFWLLAVAAFVSGLLSGVMQDALRGSVLETQTAGFIAVLALAMTAPLAQPVVVVDMKAQVIYIHDVTFAYCCKVKGTVSLASIENVLKDSEFIKCLR